MYRFVFFILILTGCCKPGLYQPQLQIEESDYYLVLLVDARQLDYSSNQAFFRSMVKHPSDGSKNCDVGHAWICLKGILDGQAVELEGGLSGEAGQRRLKYFEGIGCLIEKGDDNPVRYLWTSLEDGYFEEGAGNHVPTYAIKVDLTQDQFHSILNFVERYPFHDYSLTKQQCCSFVEAVARLAGLELDCMIKMDIQPTVKVAGETVLLWTDPYYSEITFPCPEILEESMKDAVKEGRAHHALDWYLSTHPKGIQEQWHHFCDDVRLFPSRLKRLCQFK